MSQLFSVFSAGARLLILVFAALGSIGLAQTSVDGKTPDQSGSEAKNPVDMVAQPAANSSSVPSAKIQISSAPTLGPGDELEITVYGAPDLSEHTRVAADGTISLPLTGDVRVVGLSSKQAEGAIEGQLLRNNVLRDPQVSVYVKEYTDSRISVAGEVSKPGAYSALGPHRLFDILQAAGGVTEKAANTITISHRGDERPITLDLSRNPGELSQNNVELLPGDTVVVPRAGIVYVLGEVLKPGGYVLNSSGGITLLRVVAAAGGPTRGAAVGRTTILRRTANGLEERAVPLKALMRAKAPDLPVQADDIVYIPGSRLKNAVTASMLLSTLGPIALYRIPF